MNTERSPQMAINEKQSQNLIHDLEGKKNPRDKKTPLILGVIIALGIFTGFILYRYLPASGIGEGINTSQSNLSSGKAAVGSTDTKTFRDTAEGVLEEGGLNGEGTHKLIRPGGESQTVYLTSTVLDLNEFVGKKIRVWGETHAAQKAGWLMDVGRVELLSD